MLLDGHGGELVFGLGSFAIAIAVVALLVRSAAEGIAARRQAEGRRPTDQRR